MTEKEIKLLNRIPKKYRVHIATLKISKSGYYNERGRELYYYTLTWDNGDHHTFDNQEYMFFMLREYTLDGYYEAP